MSTSYVIHKGFKVLYLMYTISFVVLNVFMMELRKMIYYLYGYVIELADKDGEVECDEKLTLEDAFLYSDYLLDELNNRMKQDFSQEWKLNNKDIIKLIFENHAGIVVDEDKLNEEMNKEQENKYGMK